MGISGAKHVSDTTRMAIIRPTTLTQEPLGTHLGATAYSTEPPGNCEAGALEKD
jgi:hypothetical protein